MNSTFIFLIFIFILVGISLAIMPYITRKTESFGVSIPEDLYKSEAFKRMRMSYSLIMIALCLLLSTLLLVIFTNSSEEKAIIMYTILVLVYLILSFLVYLPFHRQMKKIKDKENWSEKRKEKVIIDTSFREEQTTVSNWYYLIPVIIIIITIIYTFSIYEDIPDKVVTHIGSSGKVTYSDKSPGVLLIMPLTQAFLVGTFLIVNYVIRQSKQQIGVAQPKVSKEQNIKFRQRWSLFMFITGTLTVLLFSFLHLTFIYEDLIKYVDLVMYPFIGLILVGTVVLSIVTGQGGSKIKTSGEHDDTVIARNEDEHWKLGQFYFNKNDPAIFIEKRFGVGWSVNFARPVTWIILIGLLLLSLAPLFISLFF